MLISANPPRSNTKCYEVRIGSAHLLFSYGTLVAVSDEDNAWRSPPGQYSNTTGRHIAQHGFKDTAHATPAELEAHAARAIAKSLTQCVARKLNP
jgi:hypothetical protein